MRRPCGRRTSGGRKKGQESYPRVRSLVTQCAYALDTETQDFLRKSNPWALRDIATRLFEAATRSMWKHPDSQIMDALRDILLSTEADIEGRSEKEHDG